MKVPDDPDAALCTTNTESVLGASTGAEVVSVGDGAGESVGDDDGESVGDGEVLSVGATRGATTGCAAIGVAVGDAIDEAVDVGATAPPAPVASTTAVMVVEYGLLSWSGHRCAHRTTRVLRRHHHACRVTHQLQTVRVVRAVRIPKALVVDRDGDRPSGRFTVRARDLEDHRRVVQGMAR